MSNPATVPYPRVNQVTSTIVTAAMKVHSVLGPGWVESAYQACLFHELRKPGLKILREVGLPVIYDGETLDLGDRVDLLVVVKGFRKCLQRPCRRPRTW